MEMVVETNQHIYLIITRMIIFIISTTTKNIFVKDVLSEAHDFNNF